MRLRRPRGAPRSGGPPALRRVAAVGVVFSMAACGDDGDPSGPGASGFAEGADGRIEAEAEIPLAVLLRGATGSHSDYRPFYAFAEARGTALLIPKSRSFTWDRTGGTFGPDIAAMGGGLKYLFERVSVDPGRMAIAGFSDGASYTLSLGLTNGDLFHSVIALSPGFLFPAAPVGSPEIFVSHGTADPILPIGSTSRPIVVSLHAEGYTVVYGEFEGGHIVGRDIVVGFFETFLQRSAS